MSENKKFSFKNLFKKNDNKETTGIEQNESLALAKEKNEVTNVKADKNEEDNTTLNHFQLENYFTQTPKKDPTKLSLEEYMAKVGNKPQNMKAIRTYLFLLSASIGIVIFACLFMMVVKLFELHQIAGFVGIGVSVLVFIFVYLVPLIKLKETKAFITIVDERNAKQAQKYNKMLREDIADKMIDFEANTDNIGWYSSQLIGDLAIARNQKDDEKVKECLTKIYETDIKKNANRIISEHALKVGVTTAISQSDKLDTLFVSIYDLDLIKQIIMLYGFRPSDAKLAKIYRTVITNALVAFGIQSGGKDAIKKGLSKITKEASSKIPVLGGIVGTVIESSVQGITNASLTVLIGFQTKKYLKEEYHYQDLLDNVELENDLEVEQEENKIIMDVSNNLASKTASFKKEALS